MTQDVPLDFRAFLHRHADLLRAVPDWEIRLLRPGHLTASTAAYRKAFHEELALPLRPAVADELAWYFRRLRAGPVSDDARLREAQRAFAAPRYRALYRAWRRDGNRVLHATTSPILADRVAHRIGRLDCHVPAHRDLHLTPLGRHRLNWCRGERVGERVPKRSVPPSWRRRPGFGAVRRVPGALPAMGTQTLVLAGVGLCAGWAFRAASSAARRAPGTWLEGGTGA